MIRLNSNLIIILLAILSGCVSDAIISRKQEDFISVDVTKNYNSRKELILQDFMEVDYIALETKDGFHNQGSVMDIGKNIILVTNRIHDGDIFVYDRTGKALRKINHRGPGPEEYITINSITLDEDNDEMFVNSIVSQKILVYDLYGNFKRSLKHKEGDGSLFYKDILNYDKEHLICYDGNNEKIPFVLISKQNGNITKEIKISFSNKKSLVHYNRVGENINTATPGAYRSIINFDGNWMLLEHSSDTVYTFSRDNGLRPFIVRTPSVDSMDPEIILIFRLFSYRYYFMETMKNVFDFSTRQGFPKTFFMYDAQENDFFGYNVYNGDYSTKKEVYMNMLRPVNNDIEYCQHIEADQLVEDYAKGILKGRLNEIAAGLEEEDNPVIMLIKQKKIEFSD